MCVYRREFISDDPHMVDVNLAECVECGYQHGYIIDEVTGEKRPSITPQQADKARREFMKAWQQSLVSSGVRLEAFNGKAIGNRLAAPQVTNATGSKSTHDR